MSRDAAAPGSLLLARRARTWLDVLLLSFSGVLGQYAAELSEVVVSSTS